MEAANRGAAEAGGRTIGLNIGLPHEQRPNGYITPGLGFEFHYFFMRKLWFTHLAKAIVIFPGGFGTLDELFENLTLSQTGKLDRGIFVLLYGREYWREIINFDALLKHGMISAKDASLIRFADAPEEALGIPVHVINSHFGLGRDERLLQASTLLDDEWLGQIPGDEPVILCGDFNSSSRSPVWRKLHARFPNNNPSLADIRVPPTFPSLRPVAKLDHIFLSHHFEVRNVTVPTNHTASIASDHLPLCVEIEIKTGE